jgi:hypothetical protein
LLDLFENDLPTLSKGNESMQTSPLIQDAGQDKAVPFPETRAIAVYQRKRKCKAAFQNYTTKNLVAAYLEGALQV